MHSCINSTPRTTESCTQVQYLFQVKDCNRGGEGNIYPLLFISFLASFPFSISLHVMFFPFPKLSGETTARRPSMGHSEADFWDQVADGATTAKVCSRLPQTIIQSYLYYKLQGVFDFNPSRRVKGGYKRKAAFDRKALKKFNKKMAAQEQIFVSDVFHTQSWPFLILCNCSSDIDLNMLRN